MIIADDSEYVFSYMQLIKAFTQLKIKIIYILFYFFGNSLIICPGPSVNT